MFYDITFTTACLFNDIVNCSVNKLSVFGNKKSHKMQTFPWNDS